MLNLSALHTYNNVNKLLLDEIDGLLLGVYNKKYDDLLSLYNSKPSLTQMIDLKHKCEDLIKQMIVII